MFNFNGILQQKLRQATKSALDTGELMKLAQGLRYQHSIRCNGIFGNPEIRKRNCENEKLTGIKLSGFAARA